ncbi:50S ribosomal protein L4, sunset domain variant [Knoellia sp. Soil729]|uniref:50S ribosomal protein L4, sunset domain variant n=1 Tax=Knoellia sp. Soil729 TaxID=1736394 RepID=UPI0006FA716A|nr:50S ribosomal protein L4 [Knoellia sp. Soil729]KRE43051.1 50S ribosomal protein L4 [Knoellia sp. Soil729]
MATNTVNVELPAEIFDVQTNVPLIHQVVVAQLAAARQGTHSTKTRGEVRGGGRKPHRQKGTGRARAGSTRAPHWTGGGVVHGPTPRDYSQRTPKKMKAAALRGALSDRARHGRIHVVASLVTGEVPSTKEAISLLAGLTERKNMLVVLDRSDIVSMKSVRNLDNLHVIVADQLNTYDVLCADDVVFTQAAFDAFVAGPVAKVKTADVEVTIVEAAAEKPAEAKKAQKAPKADKPAKADTPVALVDTEDAADTDGGFGADSSAALEDGSAPAGFEVKGNKDSMKYHVPGSRWYDATEAEVWFRTADAAKAAGFVPAGGEAAQQVAEDSEEEQK